MKPRWTDRERAEFDAAIDNDTAPGKTDWPEEREKYDDDGREYADPRDFLDELAYGDD